MGVWDLKHLHQEITKWQKLSERIDISESDRAFYRGRLEVAKVAYAREISAFEDRSTKFEGDESSEVPS